MKPNVMRIFGPEDISSCHCTAKRSRLPDPAYKYSSIAIIQPPLGHQVMGGGGGVGNGECSRYFLKKSHTSRVTNKDV